MSDAPRTVSPRRIPVLVLIVAVVAAAAIADRRPIARPRLAAAASEAGMPVAAPSGALTSSWYCAVGSGPDAEVTLANPTRSAVTGRVTVIGNDGRRAETAVNVPAIGRVSVNETSLLGSQWLGALVDLDGGQVVAEQTVRTGDGILTTPCASATSDHWYLPDGSTAKDATLAAAFFNPFPDDAIVDLSFVTDEGTTAPLALQGLVVPGRGLVVQDIGEHVRRRDHLAMSVAVRTGRIITAVSQTFAPAAARKGSAVVLAAPSLGDSWYFPEGYTAPGVTERFWFYNPTKQDAEIELSLDLEQGRAEPFDLTVRAGDDLSLTPSSESRIPAGVAHAARVRSTNGVSIVAMRTIDAASPSPRAGLSSTMGSRRAGRRWLLAAGGPTGPLDEWVVIQNPGRRQVSVSVVGLAGGQQLPIEGMQNVAVPAFGRRSLRLGDHLKRADLPVLVEASGDVVAERSLYWSTPPGFSAAIGIPLP